MPVITWTWAGWFLERSVDDDYARMVKSGLDRLAGRLLVT